MMDHEYKEQMLESQRNQEEYLRQIADHLCHLRAKLAGDLEGVFVSREPNDSPLEVVVVEKRDD
ncbi:hypothetical protein F4X88_11955 [Candidatus Poribacteria bacterium]|nr:hypothetical protein [Candidatus Poribacteria bacterium]MYA57004.1 hypothetical protein [Candidatus Poribacteria bacterium]